MWLGIESEVKSPTTLQNWRLQRKSHVTWTILVGVFIRLRMMGECGSG